MGISVQVMISEHWACPFGSSSAVYNWERVGAMLAAIATSMLYIATLRYVDDFIAPEAPDTMAHAMNCFARLIRALMGASSIQDRKLGCGSVLTWLGISIAPALHGFRLRPAVDKAMKCIGTIRNALADKYLSAGCAEKLAGRLT